MSLTAYSHTFKKELQVSQLKELFDKAVPAIPCDFKDFVRADVECSSCLAKGASVVREGKNAKGEIVKQEHFAFRDASGGDPHQKYCDHYTGPDKIKSPDNDALIDFRTSNSPVTEIIKKMVCAGIENKVFTQQDIRNMREWYIDIRTNNTAKFEISPHLINIAHMAFYLHFKTPKVDEYIDDKYRDTRNGFNLDHEVYKSLVFKHPQYRFTNLTAQDKRWLNDARLADVRKKAALLIKTNNGELVFDRRFLDDKAPLVFRLANEIRTLKVRLSEAIPSSRARYNNPLMALASLLLFVSDWDYDLAVDKLKQIVHIKQVIDLTAGNVIGLNPFINHSAWSIVQILNRIKSETNDQTNDPLEFDKETERLKKVFSVL
jgi:hypothetical protein